jgi:hypothetical protein
MTNLNLKIHNYKTTLQDIYVKKPRNIEIFMNNLNFIGVNRCKR